jgi:hypothetical protein
MGLGLLRGQFPPRDHILDYGMVCGHASDPVGIHIVSTAVADVEDRGGSGTDQECHKGGSHATEFLTETGLLIDGNIGEARRVPEDPFCLSGGHVLLVGPLDLLCEYLASKTAGNIARLGTAHAVTNNG